MDSSIFFGGSVLAAVIAGSVALFAPAGPDGRGNAVPRCDWSGHARGRQLAIGRVLDLATPEGAGLAHRGGVLFPPGIFIDGEPFSYGRPSKRRLRRELNQRLMREEARA